MASGSECGSASTFEMTGIRGAFSCVPARASLDAIIFVNRPELLEHFVSLV